MSTAANALVNNARGWLIRDLVDDLEKVRSAYLYFLCTQPSTMWNQEIQFWRPETCRSRGIGAMLSTTFEYRVQHLVSLATLGSLGKSASKHCSDEMVGLV